MRRQPKETQAGDEDCKNRKNIEYSPHSLIRCVDIPETLIEKCEIKRIVRYYLVPLLF